MFVLSSSLRQLSRASVRSFSSAASSTSNAAEIDWSAVRAKMMTDETRADADRAKEAFQKRLSAATSVGQVAEVDWSYFKKALPELDIDSLKVDFLKAESSAKPVTYDASADAAAHAAKEAGWTGFSNYCASRITELKALQAEQAKHKLHAWYRRRQLYSRFPGLYESLHHKVRGEWDVSLWGQYIAYRAKQTAFPWDPNHGEVDDQKKRELMLGIAAKAGVKPEALGFVVPAEAKPVEKVEKKKHH